MRFQFQKVYVISFHFLLIIFCIFLTTHKKSAAYSELIIFFSNPPSPQSAFPSTSLPLNPCIHLLIIGQWQSRERDHGVRFVCPKGGGRGCTIQGVTTLRRRGASWCGG